jgi:hypothetical protein
MSCLQVWNTRGKDPATGIPLIEQSFLVLASLPCPEVFSRFVLKIADVGPSNVHADLNFLGSELSKVGGGNNFQGKSHKFLSSKTSKINGKSDKATDSKTSKRTLQLTPSTEY